MKKIIVLILITAALFYSCKKKSPAAPSAAMASQWVQTTAAAAFSPRNDFASVVYNNEMWVIGGGYGNTLSAEAYNDVWYSSDSINWTGCTITAAALSPRSGHTGIVFNNAMWVIGGANTSSTGEWYNLNDVWESTDGVNWTYVTGTAAFSPRAGHTSVVYNNEMWVIGGSSGGYDNDVWYSTNGSIWTEATGNAAFSPRTGHTSVVYNNEMWVIAGADFNGDTNDVWYSSDGINWTCTTGSAAFSSREYHTSVVYNNEMWVIGGEHYAGGNLYNDVWYSSDGITWTESTGNAAFSTRQGHASVVFNHYGVSSIWVIAGYDSTFTYKNDVWYSQ
jgi:hypothetical protein